MIFEHTTPDGETIYEEDEGHDHNVTVVLLVIGSVAVIAILIVIGMLLMAYQTKPIPDQIDRLGTLAVGGLLGFLAKTYIDGKKPGEPDKVEVTNTPADPVPTSPAPGTPPTFLGPPPPPYPMAPTVWSGPSPTVGYQGVAEATVTSGPANLLPNPPTG